MNFEVMSIVIPNSNHRTKNFHEIKRKVTNFHSLLTQDPYTHIEILKNSKFPSTGPTHRENFRKNSKLQGPHREKKFVKTQSSPVQGTHREKIFAKTQSLPVQAPQTGKIFTKTQSLPVYRSYTQRKFS